MHQSLPAGNEQDEVGKFVIGPPGLQAHVPVRRGWLARLFRRKPSGAPIRIWHGAATVWANADDDGNIDVYLDVVNLHERSVDIQRFDLAQLLAGGYSVAVTAAMFTPAREFLRPHEVQRIHLRCPIAAAGIRHVLESTQAAQNPKSSPRLEIQVWGTISGIAGRKSIREYIQLKIASPILMFSNPSARAQH